MSNLIPKNDAFEDFLSKCAIVRERPKGQCLLVSDSPKRMSDGTDSPKLYLTYPDGALQLESVLAKLSHAASRFGCADSRALSIVTLALIVETKPADLDAVEHANRCLEGTHSCRLMQSVVIPANPRPDYEVSFGTYAMRYFDPEKLLYWANRCKSAYPTDIRNLRGWLALERDVVELSIIDWQRPSLIRALMAKWHHEIAKDVLLDGYYSEVAQAYADQIKGRLKQDVLVLESGAMVWVDLESLLGNPFTKVISLFQWKAGSVTAGWALYSEQIGLYVNMTPPEVVSASREWLEAELGFKGLSDESAFHRVVRTYCRFLHTAQGHRIEGRRDEAFLHFAIALDLLLGSEGRSSDSVSRRAGTLTYQQVGVTLDEQTDSLKRLYGARSKLVHEGRSVRQEEVDSVEMVCTEVLWAVLQSSARAEIDCLEKWIQKIDYLNAALCAGVSLSEAEFRLVGVPERGHERKAPMRVRETSSFVVDEMRPRSLAR